MWKMVHKKDLPIIQFCRMFASTVQANSFEQKHWKLIQEQQSSDGYVVTYSFDPPENTKSHIHVKNSPAEYKDEKCLCNTDCETMNRVLQPVSHRCVYLDKGFINKILVNFRVKKKQLLDNFQKIYEWKDIIPASGYEASYTSPDRVRTKSPTSELSI